MGIFKLKAGQFGEDIRSVTYRTKLPSGTSCRGETGVKGKFWYHPLTKTAFFLGDYQIGEAWGQKHITPAVFEMQPLVHYSALPTKGTEELLSYRTRRVYSALVDSMKVGHLSGYFEVDKQREWAVAEHYFGKNQSAYYDPGHQSIFTVIGINDLAPRVGRYEGRLSHDGWHPLIVRCPSYQIRATLSHDAENDVGRLKLTSLQISTGNEKWVKADGYYPEPNEGAIFPTYAFTEIRSKALENPISLTMAFQKDGLLQGVYRDSKSRCHGTFSLTKSGR